MNQRSSLSLYSFLLRNLFLHSPKPTPFLFKSLAPFSTYICSIAKSPISPNPVSNFSHFYHPTFLISNFRTFSGDSNAEFDKNKIVDEINAKFAEAREEVEAAMESKETVYFNEEAECARAAVNEVLDMFDGLLGKLDLKEREALQRSMGLKIEQLKAELQQLDD
ncbi:DNA gyrase subunit A [Bienertia sinuspersici]